MATVLNTDDGRGHDGATSPDGSATAMRVCAGSGAVLRDGVPGDGVSVGEMIRDAAGTSGVADRLVRGFAKGDAVAPPCVTWTTGSGVAAVGFPGGWVPQPMADSASAAMSAKARVRARGCAGISDSQILATTCHHRSRALREAEDSAVWGTNMPEVAHP